MDKQFILAEINRTAKENDNKPLGSKRFEKETGIKYSDWFGKYWVKWNDALREAGYLPNKMNTAYEDNYLIEKLITLIRELGHFPVSGELRFKERNDSLFPSHNTFTRLGSKKQRISKIIEYCQNHIGFEDVRELCEKITIHHESAVNEKEKYEHEEVGFVYLLKSGKYHKIGKTNCAGRREYELRIQLPEESNIIHKIKTDDPTGIEFYWHKRFGSKRKKGEWFELNREDVKAFKRRKFQ